MAHRLAPEAKIELEQIWYYVASESGSPLIADRIVDGLTSRFILLAMYPHLGRRRDHDLRSGLRSFVAGEYVILYRTEEQDVLILNVIRGSRDIGALFEL